MVSDRVYDRVPRSAAYPYVEFGDTQVLDVDEECHQSFEIYQTVHVWSEAVGNVEAMRIVNALREAVRAAQYAGTFTAAGYQFPNVRHESTRYLDDPDGLTTHAIVTFQLFAVTTPES